MTENKKSWLMMGALWALLLVLAALRPLSIPDEGRYAEISRWMLVSGDWLTPRLDGIPFFHKPPLLHWMEALSFSVFGVSAWAARLVPALHAGLMVVTVYLAAQQVSSPAVARRAALMLGTSLSFLAAGQYVNHDMLVAAWISVAIWAFALAFLHGPRPHAALARLGFVACALGVLSKGLIGLALPGLVLLVWLLWTRQLPKVLRLPWASGLALFAVIALPWFVLAQRQYPDFFGYLFGVQQFGRYTGTAFNNPRPWWFYLPVLVGLFFPWIVFALNQAKAPVQQARAAPDSIARPVWLLCWMGGHRRERAVWGALCLLALGVALAVQVAAGRHSARQGTQDIARTLACQGRPSDTVYALGEYPYDLPFYTQSVQPMVVVQDWPALRRTAGDNWRRELFEGADFDAAAARVLQTPEVLVSAAQLPGRWLVAPNALPAAQIPAGWVVIQRGAGWSLWRSAPERPESAEHKGLAGCQHHGGDQRQP